MRRFVEKGRRFIDRTRGAASQEQVGHLASELNALRHELAQERMRADYLLALQEGLFEQRKRLQEARGDAAFQRVFEKDQPLVSVCVSTCNRSRILLDRCIASLLRQTYTNLQIVVVGDHCTDDTAYRLAKLGDSRIQFENLPQRGPYPAPGIDRWRVAGTMATNRALDLAEGDFVAHLDDDDESDARRFELMVEAAKQSRAEFLWHKFFGETPNGVWVTLGEPDLRLGTVTTGSIFYHRFFKDIQWDPYAFRMQEPGDWNRIRKIKFLQPKLHFMDQVLMIHHREGQQPPFVRQPKEAFVV